MKKSKQFTLNITTDGPSGKNKSLINLNNVFKSSIAINRPNRPLLTD